MATQSKKSAPVKRIKLFEFDLTTEKLQKLFDEIYTTKAGNWKAIKSELTEDKGFSADMVKKLEFTDTLAKWSNDDQNVISLFKSDTSIHSLRDVALKFNKASFIKKVKDGGSKSKEEAEMLAKTLHTKLFDIEPTAMVINMVKDPDVPILNDGVGATVVKVLETQPGFNIRTTSVNTILKNEEALKNVSEASRKAVSTQLKTLQRIVAVSPVPEAVPALYNAKIHTAFQIAEMPQQQFMAMMKKSGNGHSLDDDTLNQIYGNAQKKRALNEHALMSLMEANRGTGVAMIDNSLKTTAKAMHSSNGNSHGNGHAAMASTGMYTMDVEGATVESVENVITKNNLSWDLLFGDGDFCECGECNSVYSPASYYVELLQYLRNNNLDPSHPETGEKGIAGTCVEKLFDRRPDLGCLELTCTNSHTILPYVDLVNEVMENYVAFKKLKPFNVTDETTSELLAEPQNTEYQAYCILKDAVYPFTLPYHQPIDAARIYLKYLETSRHELIDKYRVNNAGSDTTLAQLKDDAVNRAADAEFLHLTKQEYIILTKESFQGKALLDKLKNKTHTDAEYREYIGVKPVCKYFGFEDNATMLGDQGLTQIKKEFLPRTGIDYFNLVDLLKTQYINPYFPKGKAKAIMETIRFSYRFLQNFATVHGIDKMAEVLADMHALLEVLPQLEGAANLLRGGENGKEHTCPKSKKEASEITRKDILHWVKCHFENVGKMIVIESGRGCLNGEIISAKGLEHNIQDSHVKIVVENCKIAYHYRDKQQEIATIDKKTGKVTFTDPNNVPTAEDLKNVLFVGNRGDKGVFMVIENEIYLVLIEQRDSCDLDSALLQHLDGSPVTVTEYDRVHRFIRLWRKLGWTIDETDKAIIGLSTVKTQTQPIDSPAPIDDDHGDDSCHDCDDCDDCDDCGDSHHEQADYDINTMLIHQLVAVKQVLDKTGIEVIKLLSFWNNISTAGEKSLYKRLFLTHNLLAMDKVFEASGNGNFLTTDAKITEHIPVLMAAFNLTADNITSIMNYTGMEDKLTLSNVSVLYRYRLLSKAIGLKIPDFVKVLPLFGNVFYSAHATLNFLNHWGRMEEAGFEHRHLNYIIRNVDDDKKPLAPTQKTVLQLAKTLYEGLNAIDAAHQDVQAEASITDADAQAANIREQATAALIRTKASLLFDGEVVEKIIGFLEGAQIHATNAPKNLTFTIADDKTLKNKLKYDATEGAIQITGILTAAEEIDFKALSNDPNWSPALTRIQKRQAKLFKELLSGIFENEKTKTTAEKDALKAIINAGDISIPLEEIPDGQADTNTAPAKRAAFLSIFMPYLRQELTHRFVIDTLSSLVGLTSDTTDVLVSKVLKLGTPAAPIYSIFENIKDSSKPVESNWSGYFSTTVQAPHIFVVKNSDTKPVVTIDGALIDFTAQEDPTNEWWSAPVILQRGRLYKLTTTGVEMKNVFWKTPASAITAIPSSALIPDFASQQCEPALIALKKASILVSNFKLSADDVAFFDLRKASFDGLDFNALTFVQWLRLEAFTRLRNSLPEAKLTLIDLLNFTHDTASDATLLSEKIAAVSDWEKERIDKLIAAAHFNLLKLEDFQNEKNLLKLQEALAIADKVGMDIDLLFDWAVPTSKFNKTRTIADGIKNAIRAKYNQTDWEQVVKPLHDQLRNNQKDALIAYLLQQKELRTWGVRDADGLFEFFLIDVQMDACMDTSRIKQAISSVQLFIQRCFLGLEEEYNNITPETLDRARWDWMQRYRVWEANRKVFLYPENWIESNLRDDKTPFFKELESELLQKDINKQNVTDALKSYLYKVDEVANMEVIGLYVEGSQAGTGSWNEKSKLHVFSRTRSAPFFFYYRYLALDERNWYPWEKMQVDIPCYDVEDPVTHEVRDNGCYLTPVTWNNRLMVFFPHIMKKTKPNPQSTSGNFESLGTDSAGIEKSQPIEYFEIKMGWSEYRNGKWTQKQVSKDSVYSDPLTTNANHRIEYLKFIPKVTNNGVTIYVDDNKDVPADAGFKGKFDFDGTSFTSSSSGVSVGENIPITYFNQDGARMYSWQLLSNGTRENKDLYFEESGSKEVIRGLPETTTFHNAYTRDLLGKINTGDLEQFFGYNLTVGADDFGPFDHDNNAATPEMYHELKRPYSLYNWEMFFHTPVMLADALSKAQQFEEAMKWYHHVFNPIASGTDDKRFWQFKPFKEINSQNILNSIFNNLKPNQADQTISEWRDKPFMPHVVARSRPVAYMKWVVMKYIDNLVAWGDYLFRQDTIETINQATQLYILAGHILGPKPMMIPKRGKIQPQTYLSLLDKWDAFGNAMVELELAAPFSNQTTLPFGVVNGKLAFANIFGLASSLYFCIPNNPKLLGYWDTISDRLYKIRHCQNIQGIFRKLPLFEPPIDPALLVKAAAQGLSIASVLNDLNTPLPNYRFYYLLQKALELCAELKSLGSSLLSAIEKKDNEALALLRAKHENALQNLVMEIRKKQLEEAQKTLESLEQNRKAPEARMRYYLQLIGEDISKVPGLEGEFSEIANSIEVPVDESGLKLIRYEKEDMDKTAQAQAKQIEAALPEKLASIMHIIPSFGARFQPFGVGGSINFGGSNLGAAFQAWAKFLQLDASEITFAATNAGKKAGFLRALQDRVFQANAAGFEIKQIDKQVTAQKIKIDIANQEILNQQKLIDNATEVEEFLKSKYTNDELYTWMRGSLKTLYYQVYSLAYELAKKAEKVFRFERGLTTSNFIESGYWDAGREGLLSGEQLYVGLKQLESAYQSERGYDYEITKNISLRQINPLALIQLRETGKCEFALPEVLFDMDYPGHYKRRIKSLSISIPCVAGPHTGINATLRLMENKFRNSSLNGKAYEENTEDTDERFNTFIIPISAIAASNAQNDSGVFDLNFKDERYLPFEGAGVISRWRLELPELRQFDYNTIPDIVLHIRYQANEGGEHLKKSANEYVRNFVKTNEDLAREQGLFTMIDLKHDMPTEWYKATTVKDENGDHVMDLGKLDQFVPYYMFARKQSLKATDVILATDVNENTFTLSEEAFAPGVRIGSLETFSISGQSMPITNWKLVLPEEAKDAKQMYLITRMTFQ